MPTVGAWAGPALFAAVAARVLAGAADGPLVALAALIAPLVALLDPLDDGLRDGSPLGGAFPAVIAALVVWANVRAVGDLAAVVDLPRWLLLAVAVGAAAAMSLWPRAGRGGALALAAGVSGLAVAVVVLGTAAGAWPWTAWSRVVARPAFAFGAGSEAVRSGQEMRGTTTLTFGEPHRLTVLTAGVYRVSEDEPIGAAALDGRPPRRAVVREWRLSAGDTLALRPGDSLILEPGTRVRFEAGKHVPGAPASGGAWADPRERRSGRLAVDVVGIAVTLVGGAVALVGSRGLHGTRALAAPLPAVLVPLAAVCWGVYAVDVAPELLVGGPSGPGVLALPSALPPRWGRPLAALLALAALGLFVAAACSLRASVAELADGGHGRPGVVVAAALWPGALLAGALLGSLGGEPGEVFLLACGFAGSTLLAPRLVTRDRLATAGGAVVGAVAFAALVLLGPRLGDGAGVLARYPVTLAGPGAALAAAALARRRA